MPLGIAVLASADCCARRRICRKVALSCIIDSIFLYFALLNYSTAVFFPLYLDSFILARVCVYRVFRATVMFTHARTFVFGPLSPSPFLTLHNRLSLDFVRYGSHVFKLDGCSSEMDRRFSPLTCVNKACLLIRLAFAPAAFAISSPISSPSSFSTSHIAPPSSSSPIASSSTPSPIASTAFVYTTAAFTASWHRRQPSSSSYLILYLLNFVSLSSYPRGIHLCLKLTRIHLRTAERYAGYEKCHSQASSAYGEVEEEYLL